MTISRGPDQRDPLPKWARQAVEEANSAIDQLDTLVKLARTGVTPEARDVVDKLIFVTKGVILTLEARPNKLSPQKLKDRVRILKELTRLIEDYIHTWGAGQHIILPWTPEYLGGPAPNTPRSRPIRPNPNNTGVLGRERTLPKHGASIGFSLGGMKGGSSFANTGGFGSGGSGAPSGYGEGNQNDFGGGFGGGEGAKGLGDGGNGSKGLGKNGPDPGKGLEGGDGVQPLPASPDTGSGDGVAASAGQTAGDQGQTMLDNASDKGADAGNDYDPGTVEGDQSEDVGSAAWDYLNSDSTDDPKGGGSDPNPEDGTDESGRMKGLSRRAPHRANTFTNKGASLAQTSAIYRLLAFSSGYIGDDGGGVNPRFLNGQDPDSESHVVGDSGLGIPDSSGGAPSGGDGDEEIGGPSDDANQFAGGGGVGGPDPDNEWGAGGYNPHYQPSGGYVWTPYSRSGVGTTRAAPARVQRNVGARFK